jgi:hypothetical protein
MKQPVQSLLGVPGQNQYKRVRLESRYNWVNTNNTEIMGWENDISVRTDQIQVTEAYFRVKKLMGLLTIENPLTDTPYQVMVEESLIPEF